MTASVSRPPFTVSRFKGRPLIGQARGQLRLTCTSYAECAQSLQQWSVIATLHPVHPFAAYAAFSTGKHVTGFSVAYGSLRIQFLCHPQGETQFLCHPQGETRISGAYPCIPLRGRVECGTTPCAPLRGRGPRSGAGVYYGKNR